VAYLLYYCYASAEITFRLTEGIGSRAGFCNDSLTALVIRLLYASVRIISDFFPLPQSGLYAILAKEDWSVTDAHVLEFLSDKITD
jgi:hypothetical protein